MKDETQAKIDDMSLADMKGRLAELEAKEAGDVLTDDEEEEFEELEDRISALEDNGAEDEEEDESDEDV